MIILATITALFIQLELESLNNGVHFIKSMFDLVICIIHRNSQFDDKSVKLVHDNYDIQIGSECLLNLSFSLESDAFNAIDNQKHSIGKSYSSCHLI